MPCFCTVPVAALNNHFSPKISLAMPSVPLSLQLAVALPALAPEARLDMKIAAGMETMSLPDINFGGGGMAQIAMTLSMMGGTFAINDLPKLEFQMEQAAASFNQNVWPNIRWMTKLPTMQLLNFSIIARLVLDLRSLGIDPFAMAFFPDHNKGMRPSFEFALSRPQLRMARLLGGLPPLMNLTAALNIPPLGNPSAASAMANRLSYFAQLPIPRLVVSMPIMMKLAMTLEALATIQAAFGQDAFAPKSLGRIRMMLARWGGFRIPIPLPALALNAKLAALPTMEDIRLGEQIAGSMSHASLGWNFSPPKLAMMPFMNVMLALNASMVMALEMDPFDMCSMCPCS